MIRGIIPAAGYGTRVSMSSNQSKELLIDPETNEPLIEFHFKQCKKYKIKPLVLLRKEKRDLIKYCKRKKVEYLIIPDHNGEWYDTVLMSSHKWYKWNILMLPDTKYTDSTDFGKADALIYQPDDINYNVMAFTHEVADITKWGLCTIEDTNGFNVMCEKPSIEYRDKISRYHLDAWGILCFNKAYGKVLMNNFKKKIPFVVDTVCVYNLDDFHDLTRDTSLNLSFKKK